MGHILMNDIITVQHKILPLYSINEMNEIAFITYFNLKLKVNLL